MAGHRGLVERRLWTRLGTALILASLGPRARRRLRWARLATAWCGVGLLALAAALVGFAVGLWLVSGPTARR